jgi:hypothetical protein
MTVVKSVANRGVNYVTMLTVDVRMNCTASHVLVAP